VAHTCNPDKKGKDQEDGGLKPAQAKIVHEKTFHKKGLVEWLKV
jgi:hypothetical protein